MGEHLDSAVRNDRRAGTIVAASGVVDGTRVDDLFSVLASDRRRRVLDYLLASGPSAGIDELAAELAGRAETDGPTDAEDRQRAYLSLYHSDIPKMEDAGFVAFDEAAETVTLVDGLGPIETYLELADRAEPTDD